MARDHFRPIMGLLSAIACGLFLVRIPLASPISNNLLIPSYLPWFLMGVGFHALALRSQWAAGLCLVSLGTLELLAQDVAGVRHAVPAGVVMLVPILFAAAVWFRPFVAFLSWKPIVTIGAASYGLYLIHENVGVSILHSLPSMGAAAGAIAAVAVAAGCCAVAVASFRWIETPVSRLIRTRLSWAVRERAVAGEWQRAARTGEGRRQLLSQLAAGDAYRPNIPTRRAATSPQPRR
jgi:peptidoglycan/LPS O-acetylase OafA/YrhL